MAIGDILQLDVLGHLGDSHCVNVFHYRVNQDPPPGVFQEQHLLNLFTSDVLPEWKVPLSDQYKFDCMRATKISPLPRGITFAAFALGQGNQVGDALPPQAVFKFRYYTSTLTRSGRAAKHFTGLLEASTSGGSIEPGPFGPVKTFRDKLQGNLPDVPLGDDFTPGVWSTKLASFTEFTAINALANITSLSQRATAICQV